jgi:hypothetical protein
MNLGLHHYKKVTFYFVKKRCKGNKRNKYIITPCTLRYSLCLQIHQFLAFFFKSISTQNIIVLYVILELSCRSVRTQYLINFEKNKTLECSGAPIKGGNNICNILFCTWRSGPGTRLCDADSDRSWHG